MKNCKYEEELESDLLKARQLFYENAKKLENDYLEMKEQMLLRCEEEIKRIKNNYKIE